MHRSVKTYLLPALALIGMLATWSPSARATSNVAKVGVTGQYTGDCINPCCNNSNGCQWWNPYAYDIWHAGYTCSGDQVGSGGSCTQVWKGCHEIDFYDESGCYGEVTNSQYEDQAMCSGGTNPF